jgi:Dullard-like phosphatase family protein
MDATPPDRAPAAAGPQAPARAGLPRCCCCRRAPPPPAPADPPGRKTLVLDLDETLVHCTFQEPPRFDFAVAVAVDGGALRAYVRKRPFVDDFLAAVLARFRVVVFTASLAPYANAIIDVLCPQLPRAQRLFREHCTPREGYFVKDLALLGRPLADLIIVDNNPTSFLFQPGNAILSRTWEGDPADRELIDVILPLLRRCADAPDARAVLAALMATPV